MDYKGCKQLAISVALNAFKDLKEPKKQIRMCHGQIDKSNVSRWVDKAYNFLINSGFDLLDLCDFPVCSEKYYETVERLYGEVNDANENNWCEDDSVGDEGDKEESEEAESESERLSEMVCV